MTALLDVLPVRTVTLFGSYAADRFTPGSDIDVLVIYEGPARDSAFRAVVQALSIPGLEPHLYTESEAQAVAPTLERMMSGGISIYEGGSA